MDTQRPAINVGRNAPRENTALVAMVVQDIKNALTVLENEPADNPDNLLLYTTTVHGLKSSLANMGETELSSVAFGLEKAGDNRQTERIAKETPALINDLKALIKKLTPEDTEPQTVSSGDEELLKQKLPEIKQACERYNKRAAKTILNELNQASWPKETAELLERISLRLLHGEFNKIVEELGNC
jgi:HPt (histidine-containing phosphotransfer) domain-containing protein